MERPSSMHRQHYTQQNAAYWNNLQFSRAYIEARCHEHLKKAGFDPHTLECYEDDGHIRITCRPYNDDTHIRTLAWLPTQATHRAEPTTPYNLGYGMFHLEHDQTQLDPLVAELTTMLRRELPPHELDAELEVFLRGHKETTTEKLRAWVHGMMQKILGK